MLGGSDPVANPSVVRAALAQPLQVRQGVLVAFLGFQPASPTVADSFVVGIAGEGLAVLLFRLGESAEFDQGLGHRHRIRGSRRTLPGLNDRLQ